MNDLRKAAQQALEAIEMLEGLSKWEERMLGRACDDLRAALAQPDVPEGYVLVPVEPTPEMWKAVSQFAHAGSVWDAMLATAPKGGA